MKKEIQFEVEKGIEGLRTGSNLISISMYCVQYMETGISLLALHRTMVLIA
jgi:hypothetical protein